MSEDATPYNTVPFAPSESAEEPDIPNGKIVQVLTAARERFLPQVTPDEIERAFELVKANPEWTQDEAGKKVSYLLNLDSRRAAWIDKEESIEPMIQELVELVVKHKLFPAAHPRAVAAYIFNQLQGLGMVFQDVVSGLQKEVDDETTP